jgi:hypothetical protein
MVKPLIQIRLKQLIRSVKDIGFFRMLFLLVILSFAGMYVYQLAADNSTSLYLALGTFFLLVLLQVQRGDMLFLRIHFQHYKTVIGAEYLVLMLPVYLCLILHNQWISVLTLLALLPLLPFIQLKPGVKARNNWIQKNIPHDCIEWQAGIRKQFYLLLPLWCVAVITSFWIGSIPIIVFILGVAVLNFYERCESLQILMSGELSAQRFLLQKIKRHIQLFSVLTFPLIALFAILHSEHWYIPLAEYLIFCSVHVYTILIKYAFYKPNEKISAISAFGSIGVLAVLIPFLLPVVWLLSLWFYSKAIHKLKPYLNDYN